MTTHLQGKNVLVVGASSGIGLELATQLHRSGAWVYTVSRTANSQLAAVSAHHQTADITQPLALTGLPDVLHGLVYCPGSINLKPFHRLTETDFKADFEVNVMGAVRTLQAAYPLLKRSNSAGVVLFSTVAATMGMSYHAGIATAKGAIEGLAKSLAAEWAANQIRVNVIAPSLTDTPLATQLLATPEKREASAKRHPLGRIGNAADMANAAIFLLSPQSGWITGQILHIDGGMSSVKML
ncbi:MAG TPA: SDR family oxidoreductase [Chitinophagales bacterium]|nr:SDR family oxidoreductase [Chitinophagales bacterium]HRK28261.1 SDR family oxidoreductase [Chitinophagales bacterium]